MFARQARRHSRQGDESLNSFKGEWAAEMARRSERRDSFGLHGPEAAASVAGVVAIVRCESSAAAAPARPPPSTSAAGAAAPFLRRGNSWGAPPASSSAAAAAPPAFAGSGIVEEEAAPASAAPAAANAAAVATGDGYYSDEDALCSSAAAPAPVTPPRRVSSNLLSFGSRAKAEYEEEKQDAEARRSPPSRIRRGAQPLTQASALSRLALHPISPPGET